ncbi:PREDICTED: four-domain proteases inhibitor-like [Atta colombica]|uniref:four-domain proteases inhibitor-like n=1 Tax=Atta colombica TaxID=520822 RepID=UPI00084CAA6B|nr:PREDICTED: four-domain proteases inhibitor-like [Atta colombica]
MLFYLLLIAASPFLISAIQQDLDNVVKIVQMDANSPMAYRQFNGEKRDDSSLTCNSNDPFNKCLQECFIILVYDPICGTDKITYMNRSQLKCAQCCGKNVTIKYPGNCTNCN